VRTTSAAAVGMDLVWTSYRSSISSNMDSLFLVLVGVD
jgi:hypothetical protein